MIQTITVGIIIALSISYIIRRIYLLSKASSDPCATCQGCTLKETKCKNRENLHCCDKKSDKNLVK